MIDRFLSQEATMKALILVLAVLIGGCATMPGYGPPPNYGYREERLLSHHLMVFGEPSDWFETTTMRGLPRLSVTWDCALDGYYHHAWYWQFKENEDLPFGACWVLESHSSGRGICN